MLVKDLKEALTPLALIANRHALSPVNRSLLIDMEGKVIRGCSSYAIVQIDADLGGDDKPFFVDAASFLAVMDSLPGDGELEFSLTDGALQWQCGKAMKGMLALAVVAEAPELPALPEGDGYTPTNELTEALRLGALSCGNETIMSTGLYGTVIEMDKNNVAVVYSSNNATLAIARAKAGLPINGKFTLSPEAVNLVTKVSEKGKGVEWFFADDVLNIEANGLSVMVRAIPTPRKDTRKMADTFSKCEIIAKIPPERLAAFVKRVNALVEKKDNAYVQFAAIDGSITLSFSEGISSAEETYFFADDVSVPDMKPISVNAASLARALDHIEEIGLDHVERGALVLIGNNFRFIISGKR